MIFAVSKMLRKIYDNKYHTIQKMLALHLYNRVMGDQNPEKKDTLMFSLILCAKIHVKIIFFNKIFKLYIFQNKS